MLLSARTKTEVIFYTINIKIVYIILTRAKVDATERTNNTKEKESKSLMISQINVI